MTFLSLYKLQFLKHSSKWFNIPETRGASLWEIFPKTFTHSASSSNPNDESYPFDMILSTRATAVADSYGKIWLKITLDEVYCVQQVIWYQKDEYPFNTWTCTKDDCSNCEGKECSPLTLTVSTEGAVSGLPSFSDCRYGDTVEN